MEAPLVIVLDLDGTVLGDITPQVVMYEVLEECKKHKVTQLKLTMPDIGPKLLAGVVRPHFGKFFKDLSRRSVEFFVYTASEKRWAEFIVKQIEKSFQIKINRPIFTRNECIYIDKDYKKSLKSVKGCIVKALNRKHHMRYTENDLKDKIMVIDNRPVYSTPDLKYMLHCSTYSYAIPENLPTVITSKHFEVYHKYIYQVLQKYYSTFMKPTDDYLEFEKQFYLTYLPQLQSSLKHQAKSLDDKFFKRLRKIIVKRNVRTFSETVIQYLQRKSKKEGEIMSP